MEAFAYIVLMFFWLMLALSLFLLTKKKIGLAKKWKALVNSIVIMSVIFVIIELMFLRVKVWWFNNDYITGIFVFKNIPLERFISFIIIPICCVLIYEHIIYKAPKLKLQSVSFWISVVLGTLALYFAITNTDRLYTFVYMILASTIILWQIFYGNHKAWLTHFYLMFLIALIPFTIINGLLTSLQIIAYNEQEIMTTNIYPIPAEDFIYFLVMIFMVIMLYEPLKQRA